MNILITSAGRRVSLVKAFQKELTKIFPGARVFACDLNPEISAACKLADDYFAVPRVNKLDYIDALLKICRQNDVKMIIPTIDTELSIFSKNRNIFKENGIELIVSDQSLVEIGSNKLLTYEFFSSREIKSAKIYPKDSIQFPCFVKPVNGSSSKDIFLIKNEDDFFPRIKKDDNLICFEYLDHNEYVEYTADCYYDKNGRLKCAVPRLRIETRGGEISKGVTKKNNLVDFIFKKLGFIEGARGVLTWQFFVGKNSREIFGIELNPRFGGGFPLSYESGANYAGWLIKEYLLAETIEEFHDWKKNLGMLRYDKEIFFDLDD
jgi:carbamoyl-phosphate synthase large subunit